MLAMEGWMLLTQRSSLLFHALKLSEHIATNLGKNEVFKYSIPSCATTSSEHTIFEHFHCEQAFDLTGSCSLFTRDHLYEPSPVC